MRRTNATALSMVVIVALAPAGRASAHELPADPCPRPESGSVVPDPRDLRSRDGVLELDLTIRDYRERDGSVRYCYLLADGAQSPNPILRLIRTCFQYLLMRNPLRVRLRMEMLSRLIIFGMWA